MTYRTGASLEPVVPDYAELSLCTVLPAAAAALGVSVHGAPSWQLPEADRICVVLVDGLGWENLTDSRSRAPFLKAAAADSQARVIRAGFPTTTAASMGSFGTGRPPGQHGLVGYEILDPDRDEMFNGLHWDPAVDPLAWQVYPTVFQQLDDAGIASVRIGPERFDGSGLTRAALRGGSFLAATSLKETCDAAVLALQSGAGLVYLYWGAVDFAGHTSGWRSADWRAALQEFDAGLARLVRRLPTGTLLVVTADHGMIDLEWSRRHDLADTPDLMNGVIHLGGETRCLQLYVERGYAEDVSAAFVDRFGDDVWVRTKDEAIAEGWFGRVDALVRPRIGDVLVASVGDLGLVDSRVVDPRVLLLRGQHGSVTEAEQLVPLLVVAF